MTEYFKNLYKKTMDGIYTGPGDLGPGGALREYARNFDPTSTEEVKKLQSMLGVEIDGILGDQTLSALRQLQGVPFSPQSAEKADFTRSVEQGLMTPEEADMLGVIYKNLPPEPVESSDEGGYMIDDNPMNESVRDFINRHTALDPMDTDDWSDDSMYEDEDAMIFEEQRNRLDKYKRSMLDEAPYTPDEYTEMDRYDVDGNLIGGSDYKGPASTNLNIFKTAFDNMMPNLDKTYNIDMGAAPSNYMSGVRNPDWRIMTTPEESQSLLNELIKNTLRVKSER